MTLGSLFSGAGGFELAGAYAGFTPLWASEIEPFPIRVTTRRFPEMKHLGNITEVNGAEVDPVDVITFGSPCQDLSVANGNRKGLGGARSGLFHEAIRIIKEMREATNGQYPAFIVWENVPGAFSSNGGRDFAQVLEEIAKIKDPTFHIACEEIGRWDTAGFYGGDGLSIAWRVYDAQFWGVPQRRKRIYLVADFRGQRAGRVQFERESLLGDIAPSRAAREAAAPGAGDSLASTSERADSGGNGRNENRVTSGTEYLTAWDSQSKRVIGENRVSPTLDGSDGKGGQRGGAAIMVTAGFHGHKSVTGNICFNAERSPCLETKMPPNVMCAAFQGGQGKSARSIAYSERVSPTLKESAGGNRVPCVIYPDKARTLAARHDGSPCLDRGQNLVAVAFDAYNQTISDVSQSICARNSSISHIGGVLERYTTAVYENHQQDGRITEAGDAAPTVAAKYGTGGNNTPLVTYAFDRAAYNQGANAQFNIGVQEEKAQTVVAKEPGAVAQPYIVGNGQPNDLRLDEKARTLNCMHDQQIAVIPKERRYLVRRLTPLECCRLQGFPDYWAKDLGTPKPTEDEIDRWQKIFSSYRDAAGKKGQRPNMTYKSRNQIKKWLQNPHSDSAEYKMWGNSLAIPCAYTVLAGIAEELAYSPN